MEKYFIVTGKNSLRKDYMDYLHNVKDVNVVAKKFMEDHGFESTEYSCNSNTFYIVPTKADSEKYSKILSEAISNGLCRFKRNSKIGREWISIVRENNLKIKNKPIVVFYFKGTYGRNRSNIFMIDNIVYCCLESEGDFETPEGMTEIKASEYYKVIEDYKEQFK